MEALLLKRKIKLIKYATNFIGVVLLCSCSFNVIQNSSENATNDYLKTIKEYLTSDEDKIVNFDKKIDNFNFSNGYKNQDPFDCYWSKDAINIAESKMSLSLINKDNKIIAGEFKSNDFYSSGYFSTSMMSAKKAGVISSFFTYTSSPWDEIDIEFLGDKSTGIQLNYYHNGIGKHEYYYDLGFDGSLAFHEYAFYWDENQIVWFVDGNPIHYATIDIPQVDMKIYMNIWNGKGEAFNEWCGVFDKDFTSPINAQYEWIGYKKQSLEMKI